MTHVVPNILLARGHRALVSLLLILPSVPLVSRAEAFAISPAQPTLEGVQASAFDGTWQFKVDDGTYEERIELVTSGDQIRGTLTAARHGYFSNRTTTEGTFRVEGTVRGGRASVRVVDQSGGGARDAEIRRRGAYLIVRIGNKDIGYARPGTPLVQHDENSSEALALVRAVMGKVYETRTQAGGRGAFVGGRTRLALCANGEIAYDESNVATTGPSAGGTSDLGSSLARRGRWTVVLYAGAPTVMARWEGTGSSYSLSAYFDVRPSPDGRSAEVDGTLLPVTGKC